MRSSFRGAGSAREPGTHEHGPRHARSRHPNLDCQTAGWPLSAFGRREESPGSTEVRCRVTPGGGDPRESATESTPPVIRDTGRAARVKRCGKSAPRRRQRRRQGKPHREQDQVGAAGIPVRRECRADLRAAARVGRTRRSATSVPEEWPSPFRGPAPQGGTEPGLHAVWRSF